MISKEIEEEFPIIKEMNYLNIAYGSPLAKSVQKAIYDFLSNLKTKGVDKKKYFEDLDTLRKESAILLKCNPEEIAFIKNTSEGLNIAANGIPIKRGDNIVLNDFEHPNNVYPWLNLRNRGVDIRFVPSNGRRVDANDFYDYIDDNTKVVSVGSITSLGFRFDLEKLGKICEENGSYLVVDAIQSLGIEPLDVKKYRIDLLSSSCHKGLLSPHGIGLFYCDEEVLEKIKPTYVAMASYKHESNMEKAKLESSAKKFEYGNYNYLGIYSFSAALKILNNIKIHNIRKKTFNLAEKFREGLSGLGVKNLNSEVADEKSHIVPFIIENKSIEEIVEKMNNEKIRLSGLKTAVRASFGLFNSDKDLENALDSISKII